MWMARPARSASSSSIAPNRSPGDKFGASQARSHSEKEIPACEPFALAAAILRCNLQHALAHGQACPEEGSELARENPAPCWGPASVGVKIRINRNTHLARLPSSLCAG